MRVALLCSREIGDASIRLLEGYGGSSTSDPGSLANADRTLDAFMLISAAECCKRGLLLVAIEVEVDVDVERMIGATLGQESATRISLRYKYVTSHEDDDVSTPSRKNKKS